MTGILDLKSDLKVALQASLASLKIEETIEFTKTQAAEHGDFATNVALKAAKKLGQNPVEVATKVVKTLKLPPNLKSAEVANPGFINFKLDDNYLKNELSADLIQHKSGSKGLTIVEYSSPNIAKPLGIHHLLTTIFGQASYNLLAATGQQVMSWNYIGDWGTQFGKLIFAYKQWGNRHQIDQDPIKGLLSLYVKFHDEAEKNPELEDKGREEFKKLENGDQENLEIWRWIIDISKKDFNKVFNALGGINFDTDEGESSLEPMLAPLLESGKKAGIFVEGEGGAYIVDLESEGISPMLVQKSDGATLYATRDIANIKNRIEKHHPSKVVYVVDSAQSLHFKQVFAAVRKFDWFDKNLELIHMSFGRMSFPDKRMSTRKGDIIYLEDVIDEAIERARKILDEKSPDLENKDEVAKIIGVGSLKYTVLSQSPETNVTFTWDKMLSFDGNAAPYLQYSYARANSILRNYQGKLKDAYTNLDLNAEEREVLASLIKFEEVVFEAADKLKPNLLATYLFELCQSFNSLYVKHKFLDAPTEAEKHLRLTLAQKFCLTIKKGLQLLGGIEVPEKM